MGASAEYENNPTLPKTSNKSQIPSDKQKQNNLRIAEKSQPKTQQNLN